MAAGRSTSTSTLLRALGAEVEVTRGRHPAAADRPARRAIIELPYPSVGATESALLSAALAEGKTVIRNAATEPEVLELALFLQRMGARIELSPDRRIVIEGVRRRCTGASTTPAGRPQRGLQLPGGRIAYRRSRSG